MYMQAIYITTNTEYFTQKRQMLRLLRKLRNYGASKEDLNLSTHYCVTTVTIRSIFEHEPNYGTETVYQ